jgi:hypothetical protein
VVLQEEADRVDYPLPEAVVGLMVMVMAMGQDTIDMFRRDQKSTTGLRVR